MTRLACRTITAAIVVASGLSLAACKAGSNQVDEERVEQLLAEPVMAKRPEGATVVREPVGLVSEDENIQLADGGDNGALLQLEFPADTSIAAVGREYADTVQADGWTTITIQCIDCDLTDSIRIGGRKWLDDFEAGLSIEIREAQEPTNGPTVTVGLTAPFHTSDGDRPDETEPINDCDWK